MSTENVDFTALLANMEAKRAALDAAIGSLRAAIAAGALGSSAIDSGPLPSTVKPVGGEEIPTGAFNGKTVPEAIKAYLSAVQKKQSTRQIIEALKRGGIESSSEHFDKIVYNALERMRSVTNEVARLGKEWGMTEWVSPSMRALHEKSIKKQRGKAKKRAKRVGATRAAATTSEDGPTLPSRMEEFLGASPDKAFTPSQIAAALSVPPTDINVRLGKMVARGRIIKVGPGQYRAGKTGVVRMPAAG